MGTFFSTQIERSAELMYESQLLIFITFSTDMGGWYNVVVMFSFADNPAILPVNRVLRIMEGTAVTLQVYVSGYPLVTSAQIHWYRPNGTEILEGHATFQDGHKTMVLSELQSTDGGLYRCEITTSYGNRRTLSQLDVYGMKTT